MRDAGVVADRGAVGEGFAAGVGDLLDDSFRGCRVAAGAVDGATQVVDHDLGAALGELDGMAAAQAAAGAGDDRDFAFEFDGHGSVLSESATIAGAE